MRITLQKLMSFLCCLVPFGATAAEINPGPADSTGVIKLDELNTTGDVIKITSGDALTIGTGGLTIAGNLYIGQYTSEGSAATSGNMYMTELTESPYTITSSSDILVNKNVDIVSGRTLKIQNGGTTDISVAIGGQIVANGALYVGASSTGRISNFTVDGITASDMLNIVASSADLGAVQINSGATLALNITNGLHIGEFKNYSTATGVINTGTGISVTGSIQNMAGAGPLNITTTAGDVDVTGNVENQASSMMTFNSSNAGNIVVAGTVSNKDRAGTLKFLNATGLSITGGDDNNASLVNAGDFYAEITGATNLAHGIDWSGMDATNRFELNTGSLTVSGRDMLLDQGIAKISTNNGDMTLGVVSNKSDMTLTSAGTLAATFVVNDGTLAMSAQNIDIGSTITSSGTTNITATDTLTVGAVSVTDGTTTLGGQTVNLDGIAVSGTDSELTVSASNSATGAMHITGNVTNTDGEINISGRTITIDGTVANNSGVMTIAGSGSLDDKITMGALDVTGGSVVMNALLGDINVLGAMTVSGGTLNLDSAVKNLVVADSIQIDGNFIADATSATSAGDMSVAAAGIQAFTMKSTNGTINIGGNVSATDSVARTVRMDADIINVGGNISAANTNQTLGFSGNTLDVTGNISATNGGVIEIASGATTADDVTANGGLLQLGGNSLTANSDITIGGELQFGGTTATGAMITGDAYTMTTTNGDITLASANIITGKDLTLASGRDVRVNGATQNDGTLVITSADALILGKLNNSGTFTGTATVVNGGAITNSGTTTITATGGDVTLGQVDNTAGTMTLAGQNVTMGAIDTATGLDITADNILMGMLNITGGATTLHSADITSSGKIAVTGALTQIAAGDATADGLNIVGGATVRGGELTVSGILNALKNSVDYVITNAVNLGGINVATGAAANIQSDYATITSGDVVNAGELVLAADGVTLGTVDNSGTLDINSRTGTANVAQFKMADGTATLAGAGLTASGVFQAGTLYQNGTATAARDVNIAATNYKLAASNVIVNRIDQASGALDIDTSDLTVAGDIVANNLRVHSNAGLAVGVAGNVSGGVQFGGLNQMNVTGNYLFNNDSQIFAGINTKSSSLARNYWSTVSLADDNTLGRITNATDGTAGALIQVGGAFTADLTLGINPSTGFANASDQIGIALRELADAGDAIWLLHADGGVDELHDKLRNLNVVVCNASGTLCYDYFTGLPAGIDSAYLTVRDTDNDGTNDSIYVVFDPRFGGPVEVFKLQPIVERTPNHTSGEYMSAGALDDMLAGLAAKNGFTGRHSIELLPLIFRGTNLETMGRELYDRMEDYNTNRDGAALANFSRLFQPREIEQVAGSIVLNEHTNARSFEDRMLDEFIWNRNRNLKKAWLNAEFGMFTQKVTDDKRADGNRFSVSGGFDWQESNTLILGLTARVSHMSGDNDDAMNLGYTVARPTVAGHMDTRVADTNIGLGGYMMQTLGQRTRVYGTAMLDLHMIDITRHQTYVDGAIDGTGSAFALTSEWGLMHDWLNQYIVGNMYARVGYNFGFSVTEKAAGSDYMKMKSDGYLMFTPGYSLTAQKRIYPSAWFQIRPYATIGVEYDVLGAPDTVKYKFAVADNFTKYDINIDPLWANIGGGVEMLSATGFQVGLDYRYQYNQDIQLHNIKVSGSYRF